MKLSELLKKKYSDEAAQRVSLAVAGIERNISDKERKYKEDASRLAAAESKALDLLKRVAPVKEQPKERDLTAIELCLRELDIPNLDGAKKCMARLDALAKLPGDKVGKDKQDAEELSQLVRNVFSAEANLAKADAEIPLAKNRAEILIARAAEYRIRNRFGTVREEQAKQCEIDAENVTRGANKRLQTAAASVNEEIRLTAKAARIYHDRQQDHAAADLAGLAYAVIDRSAPDTGEEMPLTREEVDVIKNRGKTVEKTIVPK